MSVWTYCVWFSAQVFNFCRYAVAWYPAYRIPDAPLNGRFLTFHHLKPNIGLMSEQPAKSADGPKDMGSLRSHGKPNESAANTAVPKLEIPIAGLKFCNLHGERWLEPLTMESVAENRASMHGSQLRNAHRGNSSLPQVLQQHLSSLQHHAEYLARGHGLRLHGLDGHGRLQQRHPDFEFFHTRY